MRIGLNLLWLGEHGGGVGRYARGLLRELPGLSGADEVVAFAARDTPGDAIPPGVERVGVAMRAGGRGALAASLAAVPALALRRRLDVVHNPAAGPPALAPRTATVVTLHDLIWLHQGDAWESRSAQRSARLVQFHCGRRAGRVIAGSRAVRDDLLATMGLDPARVEVVPYGVASEPPAPAAPEGEVRAALGIGDGPVVLCVAQKRPYKNLPSLVRAVAELEEEGVRLVVPGAPTPHEAELRALAERLGVSDRVHLPGWVSEAQLEGLYALAACLALPSLIEGGGLPVLEAMRRGVPVACSDRWALPEVAGDAALTFDPTDQAQVTSAVRRLVTDSALAAELAERGRRRADEFTWRRTAEGTLAAYGRALE
jgi:glycosyltransferase involved in cell wall biosynthesis